MKHQSKLKSLILLGVLLTTSASFAAVWQENKIPCSDIAEVAKSTNKEVDNLIKGHKSKAEVFIRGDYSVASLSEQFSRLCQRKKDEVVIDIATVDKPTFLQKIGGKSFSPKQMRYRFTFTVKDSYIVKKYQTS